MKIIYPLFSLMMLVISVSRAQFNVGFDFNTSIPVVRGGETLSMAWAGGLNNPQFSAMDFSATQTGDEIFVFDRDGALTKGFKYNLATKRMNWVPRLDDGLQFERVFPELEDGVGVFLGIMMGMVRKTFLRRTRIRQYELTKTSVVLLYQNMN